MFMPPDQAMTLYGTVAGGAATGYTDDHLVDGRPGRPAKAAAGSPAGAVWVVTGLTSKPVSHVIVANHDLPFGTSVGITGGVTATVTSPADQPNGITLNGFSAVAAQATTNTITVDVDAAEAIIGEVLAGLMTELTPGIRLGATIRYLAGAELPNGVASSLPGYDDGTEQRAIDCTVLTESDSDVASLEAWWRSTRGDTRPSVLIPYPDVNDAWVGHLTGFQRTIDQSSGRWDVTFTFVEYPRSRW